MNIPTKKLKNGFEIPAYGLGTWRMGGDKTRDPSNDDAADIAGITSALDAGVTHIDTAELYADGYAETLVSKAIAGRPRENLFITSKVWSTHLGYEDLLASCKKSLERLGTSYLDLYLIHKFNADLPLEDSMRAMDKLVADGLIRHIGVSNFTKERLAEAQSYTKNKIVCNQVHYNLMFREPERKELLQYCQQNDVILSAWRPVEKGLLLENIPTVVAELCKKYQKTPSQIAVNWLISQPNVITISKTRHTEHLEENLGALGWTMEEADIERLRVEYPGQREVSDTVPLA